jgi:hypothetical protein
MSFFRSSYAAVSFDKDRYRRLRNRARDPNRRVFVVAPRVGCFRIALSTCLEPLLLKIQVDEILLDLETLKKAGKRQPNVDA